MAAHQQQSAPAAPADSQASPQADQADQPAQSGNEKIALDEGRGPGDEVEAALREVMGEEGSETEVAPKPSFEPQARTEDAVPRSSSSEPKAAEAPAPEQKVNPSALARFHREQKEFFAQKQAFASEKAEIERVKGILANAKEDRLAALEALGYTDIKDFVEGLAQDGGRMTPERKELLEMRRWRQQVETREKEQQAAQQRAFEQQQIQGKLDSLRRDVKNRITSPEYEGRLISLKQSDEQVMMEMDAMATETGTMPDIGEAIDRVEKRYRSVLEELAGHPEVRRFFEEKLQGASRNRASSPSKLRQTRTIGSEAPNPGLRVRDGSEPQADDDDRRFQEALGMLRSMRSR